jgi:hypothetical protein
MEQILGFHVEYGPLLVYFVVNVPVSMITLY